MAAKLTVSELLERNNAVAEAHQPAPYFSELESSGLEPPHILVLTCADPRCTPEYYLNLKPGDGVIVMRNVCGHAAPVLNNIFALDRLVTLSDILVIHHTDCGALLFKDERVREDLKKAHPSHQHIDNMKFGSITGIEQSVKDDLAVLAASPFLRKELVAKAVGYIYDVKTGKLSPVEA